MAMKAESIKILTGEIDFKLGRIKYFKTSLKEWKNKDDYANYERSQKRLAKLMEETSNLLQIMKLEGLNGLEKYEEIFKNLEEHD